MMRYCSACVLPDTRPGLRIMEDGICNACHSQNQKQTIDWVARERAFRAVIEEARRRSVGYDCLIPVSGGKDSTWQVVKCLEYGLRPLAVTWKTPGRTDIGAHNLQNLIDLGVCHIDYQVNPSVERKFVYDAFVRFGSTAIPMHMALFSIPLSIAVRFRIPLVVWGENSAFEYGGGDEALKGFRLDSKWLSHHGVTHGTTAVDWISERLTEKELTPYFCPTDKELDGAGVRAVFLGYYFPWDPEESLRVARANGFRVREAGPRVGYWNYADIDDDFISIHHWMKWYKFGFTRMFDNLAVEIRTGRMTRSEALDLLRKTGDQKPNDDIDKFCGWLGIARKTFNEIAESFRNHDVWKRENGLWKIPGFLIKDFSWR
jgi:N-acetyl sugar amidotransferase